VVHNPAGLRLKKNARMMQMVFFKLEKEEEKVMQGGTRARTSERKRFLI
jgi:deoxycytidine triphosphate deaminase